MLSSSRPSLATIRLPWRCSNGCNRDCAGGYTPGNGFLYYDPNGNAGPHIHFATLTSHPTLTDSAFIVEA